MSRRFVLFIVAIASVAIVVSVGLFVVNRGSFVSHSTQASDQIVVHVIEHSNNDVVVDTGAKGDTVGDLLVFANPLYDAADKKQIGTDNGSCVRTIAGQCSRMP